MTCRRACLPLGIYLRLTNTGTHIFMTLRFLQRNWRLTTEYLVAFTWFFLKVRQLKIQRQGFFFLYDENASAFFTFSLLRYVFVYNPFMLVALGFFRSATACYFMLCSLHVTAVFFFFRRVKPALKIAVRFIDKIYFWAGKSFHRMTIFLSVSQLFSWKKPRPVSGVLSDRDPGWSESDTLEQVSLQIRMSLRYVYKSKTVIAYVALKPCYLPWDAPWQNISWQ